MQFDAIIIGAGQAGPPLAGRLTAAGMKVAVVERKLFGGTCVNTGCMPTKTMVASAYAARVVPARRIANCSMRERSWAAVSVGVCASSNAAMPETNGPDADVP